MPRFLSFLEAEFDLVNKTVILFEDAFVFVILIFYSSFTFNKGLIEWIFLPLLKLNTFCLLLLLIYAFTIGYPRFIGVMICIKVEVDQI